METECPHPTPISVIPKAFSYIASICHRIADDEHPRIGETAPAHWPPSPIPEGDNRDIGISGKYPEIRS